MPAKGKEGYSARRGDQRRAALRPSRLGPGDRRRHKEADSFARFSGCNSQIEADNHRLLSITK